MSLPVRGAWVEMWKPTSSTMRRMSLPVRGAWVEMLECIDGGNGIGSLPVRGAWVEIAATVQRSSSDVVAPRAGSVG